MCVIFPLKPSIYRRFSIAHLWFPKGKPSISDSHPPRLLPIHFQDHISHAPASIKGLPHHHAADSHLVVHQVDAWRIRMEKTQEIFQTIYEINIYEIHMIQQTYAIKESR